MTTPLKQQLLDLMDADSTLTAMLGDTTNSIMPKAGIHPDKDSDTPFLVLVLGNETSTDSLTARQFFSVWVYDDPLQSYWDIDAIALQLRKLLEGYEALSFDGRQWGRIMLESVSEEQTDDEWEKISKTLQFNVHRI